MGFVRRSRTPGSVMGLAGAEPVQSSRLERPRWATPSRQRLGLLVLILVSAGLWLVLFWAAQAALAALAN